MARLPEIWDEADALWKKYDYTGDFTNVKEQVNYALNKYKEAKSDKDLQEKLGSEQAEKNLAAQKSNAYDANAAKLLLKKHGKIGPPPDFLASQFKRYAGAAISGEMGTIIRFYDRLDGKKKWDKRGDSWVLTQKRTDHVTGEKHEMLYAFYDLRSSKGYTWLERLVIDKKNYPASQLWDIVVQILFKP